MRILVAAIVLAALVVSGIAIAVPVIARPIVISSIQAASPFVGQPLAIDVDVNVFGLLTGTVDRIHVRGANLVRGDATIGALDLTLTDVATSGAAFEGVAGTLAAITVSLEAGSSLTIDDVRLAGSSADTSAAITLDRAAAVRLIEAAFADTGLDVTALELGDATVAFEVLGTRAVVPIGVEDGAIVLVDPFGTGSLGVVAPREEDPWRFTGVAVSPAGLTIDATVDVARLLAAG